ncbi:MAG: hypothetical protein AAB884_01230, partial [Patescibacteria group bacterium]
MNNFKKLRKLPSRTRAGFVGVVTRHNTARSGFVKIIFVIIGVVVLVGAGVGVRYFVAKKQKTGNPPGVFCIQDAKKCPDGSYVGRVGPNCEFAE